MCSLIIIHTASTAAGTLLKIQVFTSVTQHPPVLKRLAVERISQIELSGSSYSRWQYSGVFH